MNKTLTRQLKDLPTLPGVYEFFNTTGKLLYVGKAKNLRSRVQSYFRTQTELSPAKQVMVTEITRLQTTTTTNETEALLLEGNLIKQHQPPYNVVLKDDKSWLYFAIDYRELFPRVSLERRPNTKGVKYFGPYPSAATARDSLTSLKKTLGLKTCTNPPAKPCFQAKLGRCLGHNTNKDSKKSYQTQLKKLEQVLRGQVHELIVKLKTDMTAAANQKQYERAARLRDQSRALERLTIKQSAISTRRESFNVFGLARSSTSACVSRFPVQRGVLLSADYFLLDHTKGLNDAEILQGFLEQYLPQVTEVPKNIIVG
ncbi:MAG: excinuclease ABC subunit UvrC, partial [Patescibacteria group bacterium]